MYGRKGLKTASIRLGTPRRSTNLLRLAVNRTSPVLPGCNYRTVPLQFHPVPGVAESNYKIFINNKSLSWGSWRGISSTWNWKIYRFNKVAAFLTVTLCHCWSTGLCAAVCHTVTLCHCWSTGLCAAVCHTVRCTPTSVHFSRNSLRGTDRERPHAVCQQLDKLYLLQQTFRKSNVTILWNILDFKLSPCSEYTVKPALNGPCIKRNLS